ncbi:MAG: site-2 protease family protein [Defluviitaleaceae bacterium]|nr:site-2 protease family protein [Defluviitaleaceae bacterium]
MIPAVVTAIMLLAALSLHEGAHLLVGSYLGGRFEKIRPFPLGLAAKIKNPDELDPWERYVTYGAGALANGTMAFWGFAVSHISYVGVTWLERFAFYNLALAVFNLLPMLPLDGGRMLQQFLANRLGMLRADRLLRWLGLALSLFLILLGLLQIILFYYNFTIFLAGVYIWRWNKKNRPAQKVEFFRWMATKQTKLRRMPIKRPKIEPTTTLSKALEKLRLDYYTAFRVNGATISETELLKHVLENGLAGEVGDLLKPSEALPPTPPPAF